MTRRSQRRAFVRTVVVGGLVTAALVLTASGDAAALYHFARLHVSPELVSRYLEAPTASPSARACELFLDTPAGRRALLERVFEALAASDLHEKLLTARCGVMTFHEARVIAKAYHDGRGTFGVRERGPGDAERLYRSLAGRLPAWCGATIAVDAAPLRLEVLAVEDALARYADASGQELRGDPGPFWPSQVCLYWEGDSA